MTKKILNGTLVAVIALTALAPLSACSLNEEIGPAIDADKTQLVIANQNRGFGDAYLEALAEEFEKAYADYQGKDGRVGVQVIIENKLDEFNTAALIGNMPYNGYDVYTLTNADYTTLVNQKYEGKSILADISDVVTGLNYDAKGSLVEDGTGTTSIQSRMEDEFVSFFNLGTETDPTFYAIPIFAVAGGGIYDADCFDENKLYFRADGKIGADQADIDAGNCGKGPDDELGTYDDGMPATWEEFKALMDAMANQRGITPFVWSGQHTYQRENFTRAVYANYEGANDYKLLLTLNGTDSEFGKITPETGYKLSKQEGKLAAVRATADIMSNADYYSPDAMKASTSHTGAQMYFLHSITQEKRIAMFMEGGWWENECRDVAADLGQQNSDWDFGKRNFKMLPIPDFKGTTLATASETGGEAIVSQQDDSRQVMVMSHGEGSLMVVSQQSENIDLAKEFVKFSTSREMLVLTTQIGTCVRPYDYEFTDEELADCTKFCQSVIAMLNDKNTDKVYLTSPRNGLYYRNSTYFEKGSWLGFNVFDNFYETKASVYGTYNGLANKISQANWPQ
jgi:ABC-type glycerol-3-phosphate transport system substrate-binding protein